MRMSLSQLFSIALLTFFLFWFNPKYLTYAIRLFKKTKKRSK